MEIQSIHFYFTGTGNSLYVAKKLEEKPISIPQIIRNETLEFTADAIGIVAPVYGHEMPPMVKQFMQKEVFHADYFYIILTYRNRHGGASELAETFCHECGIAQNYIFVSDYCIYPRSQADDLQGDGYRL